MKSMWKKTFLGLAASALVAGSAARALAVCGDLNNSGSITAADCNIIFDVAAGPPDPSGLCGGAGALACGDLNNDGRVNSADGVICNNFVLGNQPLLPLCTGQPAVVSCPGGSKTYSSDITSSVRWPNTCTIVLDGTIKVNDGVIVTIDAGTTVKGLPVTTSGAPASLIFLRGSKLIANGTLAQPIVMTSGRDLPGQPGGARSKGDWGGLVLNGKAQVNVPGGQGDAEGLTGVKFGGSDNADNSGVLRFMRIEFAGRQLTVDNELNILTMNGLGAGTTIDHVEANVGLDDCFEWFGGTVNSKFLVGTACGDDGLDWQLGTAGAVQFALIEQNISVIEAGGNGFEGDNNENIQLATPFSNPHFCNVTVVGTKGQVGTPAGSNQVGALLRRGTKGVIANSIITGFQKSAIENAQVMSQAWVASPTCSNANDLSDELLVQDTIAYDNGAGTPGTTLGTSAGGANAPTPCTGADFANAMVSRWNLTTTDPGVSLAYPPGPGLKPTGSVSTTLDCSTLDGFLQNTNYKGAFDPAASGLWIDGWTDFPTS